MDRILTDDEIEDMHAILDEIDSMYRGKQPDETIVISVSSISVAVNSMREMVSVIGDLNEANRSMRRTIELADKLLAARDGIDPTKPIL